MKHSPFFFILFLTAPPAFATDITVDNNPGAVADFTSLQEAINSSSDGDRILVAGSPTSYGSNFAYINNGDGTYTMKNNLTIVGSGYYRDENEVPANASGINDSAKFTLTLGSGTANRNLEGLTLIGCTADLVTSGSHRNILIDRCHIPGFLTINGEDNFNFTRCYFPDALSIINCTNCSVTSSITGGLILENSAIASHCVIRGDSIANVKGVCYIDATSSISNSIIDATGNRAQAFPPNFIGSCTHTIGIGDALLPSGGNNLNNQTIGDIVLNAGSPDAKWSLTPTSPGRNSASDGTDIGAFGSASPYLLSGLTGAPTITRLLVPSIASPTTGLSIEVDIEQNPE